ncbi:MULTISPECIES: hypothetical protein [unclassified Thiocapsa]|uniref:DUF4760 domain-containing protein n=1 Tax=unclassified Thiocapsa TaxID=2641286 RepID=UPI0035AEB079
MTNYECATLLVQGFVAVFTLGALVVYFLQMRIMAKQLASMQETARAESSLSLVGFLQSPEIREARHTVRSVLSKKPMEHWTDEEKDHASRVTANYDVAGALIKSGLAPVDVIASNWGPSIIHCYDVLEPWIESHRDRPGGHNKYWSNFKWLYDESKKSCP